MAITQSLYAKGGEPLPYPSDAGAVVAKRFSFLMTPAILAAAGDIVELACIPVGCRPIDVILDSDDLDTNGAPTLTIDVGVMSGKFGDQAQDRTCGNEFFAASTVGQAGGVAHPTKKEAYRVPAASGERSIGLKIAAAAATAAGGTVGLTVLLATE
ncbi:hypothetical protein GCM10007913_11790 [Devosia yakushimensis]|uniref:Uncharacterized protein n=1 Tax=Devosia yakushimensis TaxID=470028 RepID=A0ABQ5UAU3_9HYPH|nr:hypothetical protein [Devosia yakushimensis]GLQ09247.1 hypothetical protein GCM10007913_11790 [Devosia yakushimensis]